MLSDGGGVVVGGSCTHGVSFACRAVGIVDDTATPRPTIRPGGASHAALAGRRQFSADAGRGASVRYQTNRPTIAAESRETMMPESSMRPTCLEIVSFFSLSTMPLKQPMTMPRVEKLAKEVRNTVSSAL